MGLTPFSFIAASFVPLCADGTLRLDMIPPITEHLIRSGVSGIYVNGTTGEGVSLSTDERMRVLEAYINASQGRLRVMVQVGHESLTEAKSMAAHAQALRVDAVAATPPAYFGINSAFTLVETMREIAASASDRPFYYYHIPCMTRVNVDMLEFLRFAKDHLPNLRGLKYSDPDQSTLLACLRHEAHRYEILYGCDESLLGALAIGIRGAVGSTYNFATPLYRRLVEAFEVGNLELARECQATSVQLVRAIIGTCGRAGLKATMSLLGLDLGPMRLPVNNTSSGQIEELRQRLDALGFFSWHGGKQ